VNITVAALSGQGALDLSQETMLVKAALLYADQVTLASPKALLLSNAAAFGTGSRRERLDATIELLGALPEGERYAQLYIDLRAHRHSLSPTQRYELQEFERQIETTAGAVSLEVDDLLTQAGMGELSLAIAAGVVRIHPLVADGSSEGEDFADALIARIADLLASMVAPSSNVFPLFDDGAGDLIQSMISEGRLSAPNPSRAVEAGIASRLVGTLEAFPEAEIDVILDVRRRLAVPLVRFRSAMASASAEFASAAWDETFDDEIDDLYRRLVAPSLLEVDEALEELGVKPTLLRVASRKEAVRVVVATLGLAAAAGHSLHGLPALVYGLPGAAIINETAAEALERRRTRRLAEQNAFYFLYQADRSLRS
jgi:hypothetical protein